MNVTVFSTKPYDRRFLTIANRDSRHSFAFLEARLSPETASLAAGSKAVCAFVNDDLHAAVLAKLSDQRVGLIALRCAGFNNVDLDAAARLGIQVARVPAYSPNAVAEHAVALMLTLNRKTHRAFNRVREGNFALEGLLGFDMAGKTVGIIGTGRIGSTAARILTGLGCRVLASDPAPSTECLGLGVHYAPLDDMIGQADILTLHCPLTPETRHLIDAGAIARMKPGVMLINTSRGAVVDTQAVIQGLKSGRIGHLGLDVYEEETDLFFEDLSEKIIRDDVFARLITFPNVLITGHQGFFTAEALSAIAETTIANITAFEADGTALHQISTERLAGHAAPSPADYAGPSSTKD